MLILGCSNDNEGTCESGDGPSVLVNWNSDHIGIASVGFFSIELFSSNTTSNAPENSALWVESIEEGVYTPPTPTVDSLWSVDGASMGLYLPAMFADDNEDGNHNSNESFISLSDRLLLYATDIDCEVWPDLSEGWSYATVDLKSGTISSIEGTGEILFSTYINDGDIPPFEVVRGDDLGERVAVIPEIWADLNTTSPLLLDQEITGNTYTIALPEWPIDEHLQAQDINGQRFSDWFYSVELFATYVDSDLSTDLTYSDEIAGGLCIDEDPIAVVHTPNADTIEEALYMTNGGLVGGWGLWRDGGDAWEPVVLTENSLVESGEDCPAPKALQ